MLKWFCCNKIEGFKSRKFSALHPNPPLPQVDWRRVRPSSFSCSFEQHPPSQLQYTIHLAMPYDDVFIWDCISSETRYPLFDKGFWQKLQTFAVPNWAGSDRLGTSRPLADRLSTLGRQLRQISDNKCFKQQSQQQKTRLKSVYSNLCPPFSCNYM